MFMQMLMNAIHNACQITHKGDIVLHVSSFTLARRRGSVSRGAPLDESGQQWLLFEVLATTGARSWWCASFPCALDF